MKNVKNKILLTILLAATLAALGGSRIYILNQRYPDPQEIVFRLNEQCTLSDHCVRLLNMELLSGEEIKELFSDKPFLYNMDGTPYPWENQKLVLAMIEIQGTDIQNKIFDVTELSLEARGWSNGIEGELFAILNEDNSRLYVQVAAGEKKVIVCPFLMNDKQFTKRDWNNLSREKFSLVLSYYPEKIMLSI